MPLPKDNALRKALPLFTFLTEYFPDAILELVKVSVAGNMQHNPGEPMHWARGKSMDQLNTAQRHMWDYATTGPYNDEPPLPPEILAAIGGEPPMHLANAAWRLLAQIQLDCEQRARAQEVVELFPDAYALSAEDAAQKYTALISDPLQPEERITGMHPALGIPYVSELAPPLPGTLINHSLVPGRLTLDCGCKGYCKGGHPALVVDFPDTAEAHALAGTLVPKGTGPKDPAGVPYSVTVAGIPCAPYFADGPFDPDTVGEFENVAANTGNPHG